MYFTSYREQRGIFHDLDSRLKLAALTALSFLTTFASLRGLLLISIGALVMICLSNTPFRLYRGVLWAVLGLGVFYVIVSGWQWEGSWYFWKGHWSMAGISTALLLIWRIGLIFLVTRLFLAVTPPLEMGLSFAFFLSPLIKLKPKAADFALLLSLTLLFIPMIKEEAVLLWKAWRVQGNDPGQGIRLIQIAITLLPALILLTLRRAEEVGENMMMRGYSSGKYRVLFLRPWGRKDSWGTVLVALFCTIVLSVPAIWR